MFGPLFKKFPIRSLCKNLDGVNTNIFLLEKNNWWKIGSKCGDIILIRDRPLTCRGGLWFFVSFRNYFSDNTRVSILIFFQNSTLGYMTNTLNQIIFFPPPKSEYFFSNIGNQNIFLVKNHNPPFKLNGRSLRLHR